MNLTGFLMGAAFGLTLAAARLNEYDVIHKMLLLQEFDVFLLMGSAMATAMPVLWLLRRRGWVTPLGGPLKVRQEPVARGTVLGAAVFGTGWAVAGTCPGPAVVMTAGGGVLGGVVMAGLLAGALLRERTAARSRAAVAPAAEAQTATAAS